MLPDDDYLLVMPSLAIINDKIDEAAALMKSHSEPCKLSGLHGPQYHQFTNLIELFQLLKMITLRNKLPEHSLV